jgi:hypothetical protein
MILPYYSGFMFALAKNPSARTQWHTCKEYAGRALGGRNPKRYVTMTVWNGTKGDGQGGTAGPRIDDKATELQSLLNEVSGSYKSKDKFVVSSVANQPGILQVRVPPAWCHNRITAHLLLTHIRLFLRPSTSSTDMRHLNDASNLLSYGKQVGMDKFNDEMRAINAQRRTLGIVSAHYRWDRSNANY